MFRIIRKIKHLAYRLILKKLKQIVHRCGLLSSHSARTNISLLIKQRWFQTKLNCSSSKIIAVFFAFEHLEQSAITDACIRTFCGVPDKFHIFAKFPDSHRTELLIKECVRRLNIKPETISIFDVDSYDEMDTFFNYKANIFVLGDSWFNVNPFDHAIAMFKHRERNYLYFHDGAFLTLIHSWVVKHDYSWQELIKHFYPEYNIDKSLSSVDLLTANIYMIDMVVNLTGCSNILVNAESCISLIEKELNCHTVNIIQSFLPIPDGRTVVAKRIAQPGTFVIAHFGIPNRLKQLDKLLQTVEILQKTNALQGRVKLLLAGYGTAAYAASLPRSQRKFITTEDSLPSEKIVALMKGADIVVQLRWPIMGQASGVVNEMIGLGLKCITTQGFINSSLRDCVVEVANDITPAELANVILENRGKMVIPADKYEAILKTYSYPRSTDYVYNTIMYPSEIKQLEVVGD